MCFVVFGLRHFPSACLFGCWVIDKIHFFSLLYIRRPCSYLWMNPDIRMVILGFILVLDCLGTFSASLQSCFDLRVNFSNCWGLFVFGKNLILGSSLCHFCSELLSHVFCFETPVFYNALALCIGFLQKFISRLGILD